MKKLPPDFCVSYKWCEGSVPPPDYYEYTIVLGPNDRGEIIFCPDYATHESPRWTEIFRVAHHHLEKLYLLLLDKGVFSKQWSVTEDAPVGGSQEWLEIQTHGEHCSIPISLRDPENIQDVYDLIQSMVPDKIWKKLMAKRELYIQNYDNSEC